MTYGMVPALKDGTINHPQKKCSPKRQIKLRHVLGFFGVYGHLDGKNENICRILQINLYISKKIITFAADLGAKALHAYA